MIFRNNKHIYKVYNYILIVLLLGIYLNFTSAILCFALLGLRTLFVGKSELAIYLLLFGTAFFGIIFRIYAIPIPGAAVATLIGLLLIWKQIIIIIKKHHKSFIYLLLISAIFVISYIYGPQTEYSNEKLASIFYTGFSTLIVFLVFVKKPNIDNRNIAQMLLLTGIAYIAISLDFFNYSSPQYFFDFTFFRDSSVSLRRAEESRLVYHTPALISMYGLAFLLSVSKSKDVVKLNFVLFVSASLILILMTGARQGIVGFALIILVWYYLNHRKNKILFYLFSIGFLLAFVVLMISVDSEHLARMYTADTFEGRLNRNFDRAFDIINDKPIFGVGLGGYPDDSYGKSLYPHNIVLEILSEAGFFGLILCLIVVLKYLKRINIINYLTANNSHYFLIFVAFAIRTMISEDLGANIVFFSLIFAMIHYNNAKPTSLT